MRLLSTLLVSVSFLVELVLSSDVHHGSFRRKKHLSPSAVDITPLNNITARALERRFSDARFTFYAAGLGACGKVNSGSDFIVALNSAQYDGGAHCFQTITITVGDKSHTAEIVDECPGCPFGGLDFSTGLFTFFASESVGVLTGSWNFGGSAAPPPPPPPPPKKSTAPTPLPKPISQHVTASSHSSKSSATSSSLTVSSSQPTSSTPAATTTATNISSPLPVNNIEQMFLAFVQTGSIVMASPNTGS